MSIKNEEYYTELAQRLEYIKNIIGKYPHMRIDENGGFVSRTGRILFSIPTRYNWFNDILKTAYKYVSHSIKVQYFSIDRDGRNDNKCEACLYFFFENNTVTSAYINLEIYKYILELISIGEIYEITLRFDKNGNAISTAYADSNSINVGDMFLNSSNRILRATKVYENNIVYVYHNRKNPLTYVETILNVKNRLVMGTWKRYNEEDKNYTKIETGPGWIVSRIRETVASKQFEGIMSGQYEPQKAISNILEKNEDKKFNFAFSAKSTQLQLDKGTTLTVPNYDDIVDLSIKSKPFTINPKPKIVLSNAK